jgi:hypothetical protein
MNRRTLALIGLIALAALARLLPHWPNFTPIGAMALFGAAHVRPRWLALLAPLLAMFLSDLALELLSHTDLLRGWMAHGKGMYDGMWIVYLAVVAEALVGLTLRDRVSVPRVGVVVVAGSVVFFIITNFAWWVGYNLYPHTWTGLVECYTAALPFFPATLLGDACYAALLFGGFAVMEQRVPMLQLRTQGAAVAISAR